METALPRARHKKDFAVVVWVKKTDAFEELRSELVSIAGSGPEESAEYAGMIDFHWRFESHAEALRLGSSLREIARKPEIVVLRLSSYDDATASATLKDTRQVRIEPRVRLPPARSGVLAAPLEG
jgi:hypothetical protein